MKTKPIKEKSTTAGAIRSQRSRDNLTDGYIRSLITKGTRLKAAAIPPPMVEAVRALLVLKRGIKAGAEGDRQKLEKLNAIVVAFKKVK